MKTKRWIVPVAGLMVALAFGETRMNETSWTPEWAREVVWYQIFPDRFRNGDPQNDPILEDLQGAWPHDIPGPWAVHPWGSDWYALQPHEQANGRGLWLNIQRRRYGGDLQGILDKLDYLQDLGVSALYLNPVFTSPSLHKYDGATYHHVDPTFGPDPRGDKRIIDAENPADPSTWQWTSADRLLLELIRECHKRDMRIILDGVFNHMGLNSWAFKDVLLHRQASPFRDWFSIRNWGDPHTGAGFEHVGWAGCRELPELREDENGIVEGPRQYIFDITRRWMDPDGDGDPSDGIDGWRLDVAYCVAHPFWKAWRRHVKSINPEAYLSAELVDAPAPMKPYLQGDEFDAVMNYNFGFACDEFFVVRDRPIPASRFDARLRELREAYDPCVAFVQQNLFGSHDTARIATHIVNRGRPPYRDWGVYHPRSKAENNPTYDTSAPTARHKAIHKLLVIFQMTYLGAPMIYYGDEAGMWGANDPCCRKPMVWNDLEYEDEAAHPRGGPRERPQPVAFDRDLFDHYKRLIRLRNDNPALRTGAFRAAAIDDDRALYAFWRELGDERILVAINNSETPATLAIEADGKYAGLLDPESTIESADGKIVIAIPPLWAAILKRQAPAR